LGPHVPAAILRPALVDAAFSPDGTWLAWHYDHAVHLIHVATGRQLRSFQIVKDNSGVMFRFAPDGRTLLTRAYADRVLRIWDTATGKEFRKFGMPMRPSSLWTRAGTQNVLSLAVSPDGKIAALGDENSVRLLDLSTGTELPVAGHTAPILRIQYAA